MSGRYRPLLPQHRHGPQHRPVSIHRRRWLDCAFCDSSLTMTRDDQWCTKVLVAFIATVDSVEQIQSSAVVPAGPRIMDPML